MTKAEIEDALQKLGREMQKQNLTADVVLAGGAAMILLLQNREITTDIDAFIRGDTTAVNLAVAKIAEENGLPEAWLNDGVKGFFYGDPPKTVWADYPGLRVYTVTPEYLFAMKAIAGRPRDDEDLKALVTHLGLKSPEEGLAIVERYVPPRLLTVRVKYAVQNLFDDE